MVVGLLGFVDDHILKDMFKAGDMLDELQTIPNLEKILGYIESWMNNNRLKMNNDKTGNIQFGSHQMLCKTSVHKININGVDVDRFLLIRYLGALLDSELNLCQHVIMICRKVMINLHKIQLICNCLPVEIAHTLVLTLVMSHLDYTNSILIGLPGNLPDKLQKIQNDAAKVVPGD